MPLSLRGGDRIYFCHSCGHGLAELRAPAIPTGTEPIRPALVLVADLPHHAGLARRVAAAAVDLFLGSLVALVVAAIAAQAAFIVQGHHTADPRPVAWVAGLAVLAAYQPLFWARNGRTPGMQLFGIRLARPDGSRVRPLRAVARELAMAASALPLGLGFAWAARDPRGQAWHDRIAGTVVVTTGPAPRTVG
ncbi:MAG: hypothetical protein QOD62_866 [Actinomycetota bacterium]|nr:hypothetical protein [Actinomycetota bacterium]